MTFTGDDYEKAIARIFDTKETVVGTGFLVAPGYVLTCAHVVLQAIFGTQIEEKIDAQIKTNRKIDTQREKLAKFAEFKEPPQQKISLDFHVLASRQIIEAEVIAWLPFSSATGDVAALRLLSPAPNGARPIPLTEVSYIDVENDRHSVYGFGRSSSGGRSDAYRPKTIIEDERFQLCKLGDPNDETIQPGFSGAPVWNERLHCVIGMIAAAAIAKDEQQSTAYAIPTKKLRPVLKLIDAFLLHDLLLQSLDTCSSEDEKENFKIAIEATFRHCNYAGCDRPWSHQLKDLGTDLAPDLEWEAEGRLVQFAVMLAWQKGTPTLVYDQIEMWVERCGFHFPDLLARLTRQMKQQRVLPTNECECLMVSVEQVETSEELRVSLWAVSERDTYNPKNPPPPILFEKILPSAELPVLIRDQIRKRFRKTSIPVIHLFVPRKLFNQSVEMLPIRGRRIVLGSDYPVVIRTNLKTHPIGYYYYDDWNDKWDQMDDDWENATRDVFKSIDCSQLEEGLIDKLKPTNAAILTGCGSIPDLFDFIAEEVALPVALWVRDPQLQDDLPNVLDRVVKDFPERVRQEREAAHKSQAERALGRHLSLVWEDPKIVPPDMQFDPEAC